MNDSLGIMLGVAVPLYIAKMKEKGGPDDADRKKAQETSSILGERGDILLFGSGKKGKKGECAEMFNRTAESLAVLAFCPGGVGLFGQHWEAE
jgi:hypothetical protein